MRRSDFRRAARSPSRSTTSVPRDRRWPGKGCSSVTKPKSTSICDDVLAGGADFLEDVVDLALVDDALVDEEIDDWFCVHGVVDFDLADLSISWRASSELAAVRAGWRASGSCGLGR